MNRVHRVIWSDSRQAFVVTHEKSKTRGKPSTNRTAIAAAVALALVAAASPSAMAASSCPNTGGSIITINNVETATCILNNGDSLALTNTGVIAASPNAVAVDGVAAASISNSGTISGSVRGMDIYHTASVTGAIVNDGRISGANFGIHIVTGSSVGSITNNVGGAVTGGGGIGLFTGSSMTGGIVNSGAINGGSYGIGLNASNLTGGIVNSGTISNGASRGIYLVSGSNVDSITNQAGGTISGSFAGIDIVGSTVTGGISNAGAINGFNYGIGLDDGTLTGGIVNSGTITGGRGIVLVNGGSADDIDNSGGTISAAVGIHLATGSSVTGGIVNSGLITASTGVRLSSASTAGSISNSGTITASSAGIRLSSGSTVGSISNSGSIFGVYNGVYLSRSSSVTGAIVNDASGTIASSSGSGAAVLISSGSTVGSITNDGTISGGRGGIRLTANTGSPGASLASSVTGDITNTGTISGSSAGIALDSGSSIDGSIVNSGTIAGNNIAIDIRGGGSTIDTSIPGSPTIVLGSPVIQGDITNDVGGTIIGRTGTGTGFGTGTAIYVSGSSIGGSITNSGTIVGGIYLNNGSTVTDGITNNLGGTISRSSSNAAVMLSTSTVASITNAGTITSDYIGIWLAGATTPSLGVLPSSVTGAISNSGTIIGGSNGIYLSSSTAGSISNNGTIGGRDGAVLISNSTIGSITNEVGGTISGTGQTALRIQNSSAISGGIVNDGTISGAQTGLYVSNGSSVAGDITNSGTIEGVRSSTSGTGYGLVVTGGSTVGSITNSGTIQGISSTGLYATGHGIFVMSSDTGGIENSGAISGLGQARGFGIYLLSGSTVTGSITNDSGGVISGRHNGITLSNGSTVTGDISNSGTISGDAVGLVLASSAVTGAISNTGTISGGAYGVAIVSSSTVTGGITNSGTIAGGTYAISIDNSSTVAGITNTGTINGTVELGGTTLNLDGATGTVTGAVTGGAGSVVNVNGTFTTADSFDVGAFNIASAARLNMGHGITSTSGLGNAGTLSVAAGTTATITGNYTQTSTGTFQTGVTDDSTYGKLVVTGTATLPTSARIDVNVADPNFAFTTTSLTDVISAGTLVSDGSFAVTDNSVLFDFTASLNGNAVDLALGAPGGGGGGAGSTGVVAAVTSTGNTPGLGAAAVLDSLVGAYAGGSTGNADMDTVIAALGAMTTNRQVSDAVSQMLPLMTGSMAHFSLANLHSLNRVVQAWQERNRGLSSGDDFVANRNVWLKPLGAWADQEDRDGAFGYEAQTYGAMLGGDSELSTGSRIGAAFAYTQGQVDSNSGYQTADVASYLAVLYGSRNLNENTEFTWRFDYAYNQNEGDRYIALVDRTARSSYGSDSFHLGADIGRTIPMSEKTSFTAWVRADYASIEEDGYTETGADALNLVVDSRTTDELILAVDGRVEHAVSDTSTLTADLGIGYDTQAEQASITSSFAGGGAAFVTDGIDPSPVVVRGGLGMVINPGEAMEITARYDIGSRPGSGYTGQTVSVRFQMAF